MRRESALPECQSRSDEVKLTPPWLNDVLKHTEKTTAALEPPCPEPISRRHTRASESRAPHHICGECISQRRSRVNESAGWRRQDSAAIYNYNKTETRQDSLQMTCCIRASPHHQLHQNVALPTALSSSADNDSRHPQKPTALAFAGNPRVSAATGKGGGPLLRPATDLRWNRRFEFETDVDPVT